MRKLDFHRYKYERELLIDCSTIGDTKHFITDDTPFHVSFHEILVITRGRGLFRLDDREIPFRKGTVLLLPPNKWRQWARVDREIDAYFFIFEEAFITEFFSDPYFLFRFHYFYNDSMPAHVQAEGEFFTELTDNLERIRRELRDLRKDSHHLLRALLYYSLIRINRVYQASFDIAGEFFSDNMILRFRKLLEENIRAKQSVPDYTEMLGVSKSHLNARLKAYFGKSCSELIRERLVVEIKKELLFSDRNLVEISHALDFSEPANLSRFFKKMTGETPGDFRARSPN